MGSLGGVIYRNYFTFVVPASTCRADTATLNVKRFDQTVSLTYTLHDVSTLPPVIWTPTVEPTPTVFNDLGTGVVYGHYAVPLPNPPARNDILNFALNPAGVAAFNAARGGYFSVGGAASPTAGDEYLFGNSIDPQHLTIHCAPSTPTSKDQCKDGGWRTYPGFKNQGECVRLRRHRRQAPAVAHTTVVGSVPSGEGYSAGDVAGERGSGAAVLRGVAR